MYLDTIVIIASCDIATLCGVFTPALPLVTWCSINHSGIIRARIIQELARIITSVHQNKVAKGLCFFGGITCKLLELVHGHTQVIVTNQLLKHHVVILLSIVYVLEVIGLTTKRFGLLNKLTATNLENRHIISSD